MRVLATIAGVFGIAGAMAVALFFKYTATPIMSLPDVVERSGIRLILGLYRMPSVQHNNLLAWYFLIAAIPLGMVAIFLLQGRRSGLVPGLLMIVAAIGPAYYNPRTLFFTFYFVLGGLLALTVPPRPRRARIQSHEQVATFS